MIEMIEMAGMTEQEYQTLRSLEAKGYVLAIFTPEEVQGVRAKYIEDAMVEAGFQAIECMKDEDQ